MSRFENKVVLITGGSRGIGLATAQLFKAEGARVMIAARDGVQGRLMAEQYGLGFVTVDVRSAVDCDKAVRETTRHYGQLDVLVNGAGVIFRNRPVEQTSEDEWDAIFDTNVKGAFLMAKYALPHLREVKGTIVNVASYVGLVALKGIAAYNASKAALVNLTRSIALDHAHEGIRVNCVCPGSVDTEMIHEAWRLYGDVAEARQVWAAKHPLGRIAKPEEVAQAILFLASVDASFITGVALPVDGGITAG